MRFLVDQPVAAVLAQWLSGLKREDVAAVLFNLDCPADQAGPIKVGQTRFEYFSRSTRPEAERARRTLNAWFRDYPANAQGGLRSRLSSKPRHSFEAAVFELYTFTLLRKCGFDVDVVGSHRSGKTPDFLALDPSRGNRFHVEATVIRGSNTEHELATQIYQLDRDVSRRIFVPGFAVTLYGAERGPGNIRPGPLASFLNQWFREQKTAGSDQERIYTDIDSGWRLEFGLIPLPKPEERPSRVIKGEAVSGHWGYEALEILRTELNKKRRRYAKCAEPLVVAVAYNDFVLQPNREEIRKALIGDRAPWRGAVWHDDRGNPRSMPVAVIHANGCYASGLEKTSPVLWDNPHAKIRFRPWPLASVDWVHESFECALHQGEPAASILGIDSQA